MYKAVDNLWITLVGVAGCVAVCRGCMDTIVYYRIPSGSIGKHWNPLEPIGTHWDLVAACQRLRISQSVSEYHNTVSARSSGFQRVLGASCVCGRQSVSEWCWTFIENHQAALTSTPSLAVRTNGCIVAQKTLTGNRFPPPMSGEKCCLFYTILLILYSVIEIFLVHCRDLLQSHGSTGTPFPYHHRFLLKAM